MSAGCCNQEATFEGLSPDYKRRLWMVIAINAVMFVVEMAAGQAARSQALQADALDLPFDKATFDAVLCQFGVMFFPDRVAGYAEARRVLKPGAV
jgi:ubiquinone/menaquinone biosynthesis C-methylase UbiE